MTNTTPSVRPRAQQQRRRASVSLPVLARFPDVSENDSPTAAEIDAISTVDDEIDAALLRNNDISDGPNEDLLPSEFDAAPPSEEPADAKTSTGFKLQPQYILALVFLVFVAVLALMIVRRGDTPAPPEQTGWPAQDNTSPAGVLDAPHDTNPAGHHQQAPVAPAAPGVGSPAAPVGVGQAVPQLGPPAGHAQPSTPVNSSPVLQNSQGTGVPGVARLDGTIGKTNLRTH